MPNTPLILAIDQGTTNTKAILVDHAGSVVAQASRPLDIEYPQPGLGASGCQSLPDPEWEVFRHE